MSAPSIVLTDEFTDALTRLRAGQNLFLTGKAGTGKSTLIREFLKNKRGFTQVIAPTGIAALNVDGRTIHRLFGFHGNTTIQDVRGGDYHPGRFAPVIKKLSTLIVDEVSMVRADLFDCMVEALQRYGPRPGTPYGGVQLVLVGDLYQLPPVVIESEAEYFSTHYESAFFFSAHHYRTEDFPVIELTTVFRQIGDTALVELLNAVRDGSFTEERRRELNRRVRPDFSPPLNEHWVTLATTNRIASARNKAMLAKIDAPEYLSEAVIVGNPSELKQIADERLRFKAGAQIMMLNNDTRDRWVNGTIAEVESVDEIDGELEVNVRTPDGNVHHVEPHTWEITRPSVQDGKLEAEHLASFTQLPFKLAWAITIHKSQGQTLDRVVVDLAGGTSADGQLYVGLSRCTSLEGLVLTQDVRPRDVKVNQRIRRYLASHNTSAPSRGTAYISALMIGDSGRMWEPRPIELAVVLEDGREFTSLINPGRDVGDAKTVYGVGAEDVILAPTLREAWAQLSPHLEGRRLVGSDIDNLLKNVTYELKRHDKLITLPSGTDMASKLDVGEEWAHQGGSALDRARAVRSAHARFAEFESGDVFADSDDEPGYLMSRGGEFTYSDENAFLGMLGQRVAATQTSPAALALANTILRALGQSEIEGAASGVSALAAGGKVCFTGSAVDAHGTSYSRADMEALAEKAGLIPVKTVSRKNCQALVCAEVGSQSTKARKAADLGVPVLSAQEFFAWLGAQ